MSVTIASDSARFTINAIYPPDPETGEPDETKDPSVVFLAFADQDAKITFAIQFGEQGWQNFKRHVERDGDVPTDLILAGAADMPKEPPPSMAVPKGTRKGRR